VLRRVRRTSLTPTSAGGVRGKMTSLFGITADRIDETWPRVEKLISDAIDHGTSRITKDDVYEKLKSREYQLWIAYEDGIKAVAVTEIVDTARGRVASIFICTGKDMSKWLHHLSEIEVWAKEAGCDIVETLARQGWQRMMPDYKARHIQLEKMI
jgi:hypothetical protein